MFSTGKRYLRYLPAVDEVLRHPVVSELLNKHPRTAVVETVRKVLQARRETLLRGDLAGEPEVAQLVATDGIAADVAKAVVAAGQHRLCQVINATGVILHTNLGRAPLSESAIAAVARTARRYSNLEFNLVTGKRGSRYAIVEEILVTLTGAEAAFVVNNNAAAVLLALTSLANGREVIVSRGQLVEIGGSFRIPDVMRQSGARLVEVGTTNKTYVRDYEAAIGPETALLLHVHMSNYRIIGFTHETSVPELVSLGKKHGIPVMSDLGSGFLVDLSHYGLPHEPTVREIVAAGTDVVTFSGDKLLGGPQAGIILGKTEFLEKMKRHPLARALRIDKMTLAALEATLHEYRYPEGALRTVPILNMLATPQEVLKRRARRLVRLLKKIPAFDRQVEVVPLTSQVGGGAMPTAQLASFGAAISLPDGQAADMAALLRQGNPPVIVRVQDDRLLLDVRTLRDDELPQLAKAVWEATVRGVKK